jgi:hypothetical protein
MNQPAPTPVSPEDRYAALADELLGDIDAGQPSTGFGSTALKVDNRIFAMLVGGRLVVKLPRQRVDALIDAGDGDRFDPAHGRLMKEWLAVRPGAEDRWHPLAAEALAFVGARR